VLHVHRRAIVVHTATVRGRRGLLSDYIAAIRGTMAMRRARGQVRIELAFAGAATVVALAGFHAAFLQTNEAESADRARSALGLLGEDPPDRGLTIGDSDGFVVTDGEPGDLDAAEGPATTGPDGTPVETPGTGVLPSGGAAPAEGSPGTTGDGADAGPGDGEGEGGTETSVPPSSTTEPGTSTTEPGTSTSTSEPDGPGTTPTTAPPPSGGLVNDLLDLLGL
jgi:hypothetical protein